MNTAKYYFLILLFVIYQYFLIPLLKFNKNIRVKTLI